MSKKTSKTKSSPVTESTIKAAVKQRLNELDAYQHWPVQMGMGAPTLDCIGCLRGLYFAIETKRPGEKPTLLQHITAKKIRAAGGITLLIDSLEKAREIFSDDRFQSDWPAPRPL